MKISDLVEGRVYSPAEVKDLGYQVKIVPFQRGIGDFKYASHEQMQKAKGFWEMGNVIAGFRVIYPHGAEIIITEKAGKHYATFPNLSKTEVPIRWKPTYEDFGFKRPGAAK
jgi:hypothetical protein